MRFYTCYNKVVFRHELKSEHNPEGLSGLCVYHVRVSPCEETAGQCVEASQWASGRVDEVSNTWRTWNWKNTKISGWRRGAEHVEDKDVHLEATHMVFLHLDMIHVTKELTWGPLSIRGQEVESVLSSLRVVKNNLCSSALLSHFQS